MTEPRDLPLVAVTSLAETLLEVVRQESVEDGVDGGVAVLEAVGEEDDDDQRVSLVVSGRFAEIQKYQSDGGGSNCLKFSEDFRLINCFPIDGAGQERKTSDQLGKFSVISGLSVSHSPDESDLGDPVGQPADDVDRDDGQHQLRHLPVGLSLAQRPLLTTRPHGSQFYNDFGNGTIMFHLNFVNLIIIF